MTLKDVQTDSLPNLDPAQCRGVRTYAAFEFQPESSGPGCALSHGTTITRAVVIHIRKPLARAVLEFHPAKVGSED